MMEKISVVIPTCDRPEELLKESILSAFNQTLKPLEIIVVGNGKTPVKLSKELESKVKIFEIEPYSGASKARNFGAEKAQGEFIAFLDDDDLWAKNYLVNNEKVLFNGAKCTISRLDKKIDDKIVAFKNADKNLTIKNLLLYNPGVTGSNIVIDKNIFFEVGGFDPNLPTSEDKSLIIELLKRNVAIKTLPDNQAIIREHRSGSRLSDSKKIADGIEAFAKKYRDIMDIETRLYNRKKVYEHHCRAGNYFAGLQYVVIGIALKIFKLFQFKREDSAAPM